MTPCSACFKGEQSFYVCLTPLQDHQQTAQHFEGLLEPRQTLARKNSGIPIGLKKGTIVRWRLNERESVTLIPEDKDIRNIENR